MKKQIKKGFSFALALAFALTLSACGGSARQEAPAAPEESVSSAEVLPDGSVSIDRDPADLSEDSSDESESAADSSETADGASSAESSEAESAEAPPVEIPEEIDEDSAFTYTLCFAGDVNLSEGMYTTAALDSDGLESCVSETLRSYMTGADVMCLNNEFTYTTSDQRLEDKQYTFKATPSRVNVLKELGVDLAILANNHVYDYKEQGLLDTLDTLADAGIPTIGAGRNLEEASAIYYAELEGCTVAYIAASRVEWSAQTRPATSDGAGVFYTAYDTDLLLQRVKEARENADYVVVCMHWGIEGQEDLEEYQVDVGKALADAGADVVVGDHPHQLQGIRFEGDTPVFYSMGNYWFSRKDEYTMLLNVILSGDKYGVREVRFQVVPARETGSAKVHYIDSEDSQRDLFRSLEEMPFSNIVIDEGGFITPNN